MITPIEETWGSDIRVLTHAKKINEIITKVNDISSFLETVSSIKTKPTMTTSIGSRVGFLLLFED